MRFWSLDRSKDLLCSPFVQLWYGGRIETVAGVAGEWRYVEIPGAELIGGQGQQYTVAAYVTELGAQRLSDPVILAEGLVEIVGGTRIRTPSGDPDRRSTRNNGLGRIFGLADIRFQSFQTP